MSKRRAETIYVIACGRAKGEGPAKARDLYVGKPTRRVLAEAEAKGPTFILSALHGLVDPDSTIVKTYDVKLDDLAPAEKIAWVLKVRAQLSARGIDPATIEYVGHAPTYRAAVDYIKGLDRGQTGGTR